MSDSPYVNPSTVLSISGNGVSPYSARGLTQTLDPIPQASQLWRTINGGLIDVAAEQFRKYSSIISCTDQNTPALEGVWPGMELVIDCATTLSYPTDGGAPTRIVVPGSSYVEGNYTIYRPRLTMRVVNFTRQEDEWGATTAWTLELEEG